MERVVPHRDTESVLSGAEGNRNRIQGLVSGELTLVHVRACTRKNLPRKTGPKDAVSAQAVNSVDDNPHGSLHVMRVP